LNTIKYPEQYKHRLRYSTGSNSSGEKELHGEVVNSLGIWEINTFFMEIIDYRDSSKRALR
jgi:hypothetical protein